MFFVLLFYLAGPSVTLGAEYYNGLLQILRGNVASLLSTSSGGRVVLPLIQESGFNDEMVNT
jgi:hypothetical protein